MGMDIYLFRNPYVWYMLQVIYLRNQPLYQEKLLHLMRIIVLILNKEISIFMGKSYLKYKDGFVAGTYDFW